MKKDLLLIMCFIYGIFVFGLFAMLYFMEVPESNRDTVNTGIGILIGACIVEFIHYIIGSSKGSKDKTEMLNNSANNK